jgi:hypothetical protein
MRSASFLPWCLLLSLCVSSPVLSRTRSDRAALLDPSICGPTGGDLRPREAELRAPGDTLWFGSYQVVSGEYHALSGPTRESVEWTFDHGIGPSGDPRVIEGGEGWSACDMTETEADLFRVVDATLDLGPGVPAPILQGAHSLWIGADVPYADSMCWPGGAGYGNNWRQRVFSPPLAYNGSGSVGLTFSYFTDMEECFDGVQVYLVKQSGEEVLLNPHAGDCPQNPSYDGGFTGVIGAWNAPAVYARTISAAEIAGAQQIRILLEFTSDAAYSDEDGGYECTFGPFGVDGVVLNGGGIFATYDFETGLQGWVPTHRAAVGGQAEIADVSCYALLEGCQCPLSGNVLEVHQDQCDAGTHPDGQYTRLISPIIDIDPPTPKTIVVDYDVYALMPMADNVLIRDGWSYWPYVCPATGRTQWSPRVGGGWGYFGSSPVCLTRGSTAGLNGVPATAEKVRVLIDVAADVDGLTIAKGMRTANFTPLFDNVAIAVNEATLAPAVSFDPGTSFQDVGSYPSNLFDVRAPGQASIQLDKYLEEPGKPDKLGDTLVVTGPAPGVDPATRWEARLWWRVARRAPFQTDMRGGLPSRYKTWRDRVSDGLAIDRPYRPEFTFGWMDSVQAGIFPFKNRFQSTFREGDDDFVGENQPENEMIWDDVLFPGTRIEYFITSNYIGTPGILYYYPDTTGGSFFEFEILPGVRRVEVPDCAGTGFNLCAYLPTTLYIDAVNVHPTQMVIENALATILNGRGPCLDDLGCDIPADRNWDRFDYTSCVCYGAPFARGTIAGSNNGMSLAQMLGYRSVIVSTGDLGTGTMEERDFALFRDWLTTSDCGSNVQRQVFCMNGDNAAEIVQYRDPGFLQEVLGATLTCDRFNGLSLDPDCMNENRSFCVRLLPVPGGAYGLDADVDAWGNFCPYLYGFDVMAPTGGGVGNRSYHAEDGMKDASYAQIVREDVPSNYRTILDGVAWEHLSQRDGGGQGQALCPRETAGIIAAATAEIGAALKWGYGAADYDAIPKFTSIYPLLACEGTGTIPAGVESAPAGKMTRLLEARPNPFGSGTSIHFEIASPGPVQVEVFAADGRLVRTLVETALAAGQYSVGWDGTNDIGVRVASGVYWSQLTAGPVRLSRKLLVLR